MQQSAAHTEREQHHLSDGRWNKEVVLKEKLKSYKPSVLHIPDQLQRAAAARIETTVGS